MWMPGSSAAGPPTRIATPASFQNPEARYAAV